jgi:transposase
MSASVQVFGRRSHGTIHTTSWPASEERQGTKPRALCGVAEEDDRHRERDRLISERIQHVNRIKGLCAIHGICDYEPMRPDGTRRLEQSGEVFYRRFTNRRELAGYVGLRPVTSRAARRAVIRASARPAIARLVPR